MDNSTSSGSLSWEDAQSDLAFNQSTGKKMKKDEAAQQNSNNDRVEKLQFQFLHGKFEIYTKRIS